MAKLEASLETLLNKIQETYRDCEEQKKNVITEYKSRLKNFAQVLEEEKDFDKLAVFANANANTYKVLNSLISAKTELLKIQASLIKGQTQKAVTGATPDLVSNETERAAQEAVRQLSVEDMKKIREMAKNTDYTFEE